VDRARRLLDSLEREAADEGLRNKALVSEQFPDDRENGRGRKEVIDMYDNWEKFRNGEHNGRLDKVFMDKDPVGLRKCLGELRVENQRFLELASERYAKMVKDLREEVRSQKSGLAIKRQVRGKNARLNS
jgi:hypothetical protein